MPSLHALSTPANETQQPIYELIVDGESLTFQSGQVTIIGARPGMGRSLLMLYFYKLLFDQYGLPQHFISNEEEESALYQKLISTATQIDIKTVGRNRAEAISKHPLLASEQCFIQSFFGEWEVLKAQLVTTIIETGVKFLFIDKIQGLFSNQHFRNRDLELNYIIKDLRDFAVEHQIAIVVSSSLRRCVESRDGKEPWLSDLRGSGSLEDVADTILFLHRPDYYGLIEDDEGNNIRGAAALRLAKNRKGKAVRMWLRFDEYMPGFKPWLPSEPFSSHIAFNQMVERFGLTESADGLLELPF
jgi:replicative DNA helicase